MKKGNLAGRRILVVEDEPLIAMLIEGALRELGCEIVGPTGRLETAIRMSREETLDAAILDINILGGRVFPVADVLMSRGIRFVLASGYADWSLPEMYREQARILKPFTVSELENCIQGIFGD